MQSLMRSLSPEQRAELQDTIDALLRDDRLRWDLAQLAANLDQLLPDGLGDRVRFGGDQPMGLEAALEQLGRLQALDRLESDLEGVGGAGDLGRDRPVRRPRPPGPRRGPRPRRARGPRAPARAGRLPRARRRPDGAHAARQPADRAEGPRRPVRAAAQGRLRGPPARSDRPRRRPRGDVQAVRVRRPVPPRPARDDDERADARGERAVAPAGRLVGPPPARRLRGVPDRAHDVGVDGPAGRHEPLDAAARLLPRRQAGRDRARHADPDAVPARPPRRSSASPTTPASCGPRRSPSSTGTRYEYGTNLQHGLLLARRILARHARGQPRDRGDHRRRADRALRGRPGRVQLPADPAHDPGDPARGRALHEGRHHDQHVHARAVAAR